ncbi:hypothetical protein ETD83_01690 [Actinomadura soli]|uniref:Uncharacterized protein n=1 Tax=Actinomadura soli TaxID=2508997 RepID=A0A5C4JKB5_9ACTN|nr:hypothetical protein [Actinomadura soli]TMR07157.1 hypothetical protein ETD83_01690 [Actinomadura soli]
MGYPGDQGKPGGWPPQHQPPHAPYGPGAEAPPYGHDNDEAPFAPREEGPGAMPFGNEPFGNESFGNESFGSEPYGAEPYGGAADQTAAWADEPPAGNAHPSFPPDQSFPPPNQSFSSDQPFPPNPPARRRGLPLVIGGAAVAGLLLIGGGVALSSALKDDSEPASPKAAESKPPQATPTPPQPVLAPVKLQSRTTDPKPLTLKEVFGNGKFKAGKYRYVRTAAAATKNCTAIAGGTKLDKALKKGGCTQGLRATYALSSGSLIGTVGVFNLETQAAVEQAVKAAGDKDAFLLALPGKGVSKTNGKGEALGTSQTRGHYLVMTWVQRPDGKKIASKYHAAVRVFGTQMVKGSNLALALHYRETEGKPLQK